MYCRWLWVGSPLQLGALPLLLTHPPLYFPPFNLPLLLSDVLELEVYKKGDYVVREGTSGDTFYIISEGEVKITKKSLGKEDEEIRSLTKGDYFGEQALLKTDLRTANVISTSDVVECLTLDRE